jgi:hypothetical protein
LPPLQVLCKKVPLLFETGEMIRAHPALLVARAVEFAIFELELHGPQDAFAHDFEKLDIGDARSRAAE